jgi:hypothetical protein
LSEELGLDTVQFLDVATVKDDIETLGKQLTGNPTMAITY